MAQFRDPRLKPPAKSPDPASEVMELVRLMLAECPYPIAESDRREANDRRLRSPVRAIPRGEDRRNVTLPG